MWDVSGISGAAPLWLEVMNFLHRNGAPPRGRPPQNLVRKRIEFPTDLEPPRNEWFIRGTEPNGTKESISRVHQRILYPPDGAILALDPDIPGEFQRVFFAARFHDPTHRWILNGQAMEEAGKSVSWTPQAGTFFLAITDGRGKIMDSVRFQVRGPSEDESDF
jgi:penicillin-binding protein 1C